MVVVRALVVMEVAAGLGEEEVARVMAIPPKGPARVMEARETLEAVSLSLRLRDPAV